MKTKGTILHLLYDRCMVKTFIVTPILLCILSVPLLAQLQDNKEYYVKLHTREFIPQEGIKAEFSGKIRGEIVSGMNPHIMVQFKQIPSLHERSLLADRGMKLLNYIGNRTWYASVSDTAALNFQLPERIKQHPVLGLIRSLEPVSAEDKISPGLRDKGVAAWARTTDGKVSYLITCFKDVDLNRLRNTIISLGGEIVGEIKQFGHLVINIDEARLMDVAMLDQVLWIEHIPPPAGPESNRIRTHVQATLVQNAPYNLTGNDVKVGIFEWNHVLQTHSDFSGRAVRKDATAYDPHHHTTMVAGIIGGNGSQSAANGGTAYQWKGMAPGADLFSYNANTGGTTAQDYLDYAGDLQGAVGTDLIDIANNSWGSTGGCAVADYGLYEGLCPDLDAAVIGDLGKPVTIVFSAGNERDGYGEDPQSTDCIDNAAPPYENYWNLNFPKAAKNIIAVGAIDSYDNTMTQYSSWGPLLDGRLKPEITASGHHNGRDQNNISIVDPDNMYGDPPYYTNGAGYRTPGYVNNYVYGWFAQTSCAAAATSGCLALLLEACRDRLDTQIDPLPSTLKALIIHSALDLNDATNWYNPGPDYASGYGLLQVRDAVDLVESLSFREGKVTTGHADNYTFTVPAGATEVKVTLVWDDQPAIANANPALVNDLDLKVYSPGNVQFYPWTLDPQNPSAPAVRTAPDHLNNVEQVLVNTDINAGTWRVVVDPYGLPEPPQRYSIVTDYQLDGQVDVIQVLDRSGSMGMKVDAGSVDTKIEKLRDASSQFVGIMNPNLNNRLGLILFNQDVVPFAPADQAVLSVLDGPRANHLINNTITPAHITHGGSTSIGDGLRQALNDFLSATSEPEHSRSILLVTDGMENTAEMIATVQPDLIANDITVYALGLGYGAGIDETKLVNLVEATHGTYRITSDNLFFQKLFIETLAGAVDWSVINDPAGTISAGMVQMIPIVVQPDETGVTFTVYWDGPDHAVDCELITPSGKIITGNPRNSSVRYGEHSGYVFYQVDFPLVGDLATEWAGEWKMKLTGSDSIGRGVSVRYSSSCFAESGPELEVSFNKLFNLTGDDIRLEALLTRSGMPVTGAKLYVYGDVPKIGAGNVLHEGVVNMDQLHQPAVIGGDTLSLIDKKIWLLSNSGKTNVLLRDSATIQLYDDGLHGDRSANDGIYANKFSDTRIQGSYTFRFVASGIPSGGGRTSTCEWTKSFYNEVKIDPAYSAVKLDKTTAGPSGVTFNVDVTMKDQFGNYMGPGHDVRAKKPAQRPADGIRLNDLINGTYSGSVLLSNNELNAGTPIEIFVDGREFTRLRTTRKWSVSLHGGTSVPSGSFANDYKPGMNLIFDVDYHFTGYLAVVGMIGFNNFKSNATGIIDNYWININANLRYYRLIRQPWSLYVGGGPGFYIPEAGNNSFGANAGLGLNYEVNSLLNLELGTDYHYIFDNDIRFVQSHLGVVLRF